MPGQWLLGGGSGHGFKHGPAVAEHVAAVLGGRAEPEARFALGQRRPGRSLRTAGSSGGYAPAPAFGGGLLPLVLATTATQASIVVLAPLVVEIGREFDASLGSIGLARSVLAATAVAVSLAIGPLIDRLGVGPLIVAGALLAMAGAGLAAAAPSLPVFYATQVITGAGRGLHALGRLRRGGRLLPARARGLGDGLGGGLPVTGLDRRHAHDRLPRGARVVAAGLRRARRDLRARAGGGPAGPHRAPPSAARGPARGPAGRVPRSLGAALDAGRAGGLLGLDRGDHLRRAPSTSRPTTWARPPWACSWRWAR